MRFLSPLAAATVALLTTTAVQAETPQAAAERLNAFLDGFDGIEPGYAVVVVSADEVLMNRADGMRRASTGAPMTPDTPQYIASQTKSLVGLMAARLDAEGILPLDTPISDYWPGLDMDGDFDPSAWTLRQLLSHQVPLSSPLVTTILASSQPIAVADMPVMLERHGEVRRPGFEYDNLGYNIYAAILEAHTGRPWQDWLLETVFDPLGLDNTSARTSDLPADELPWRHTWAGDGWHEMPPKPDGTMQSAGGVYMSSSDTGRLLQTVLRGEGPAGSGITASIIDAGVMTSYVETGMNDGNNPMGMPCPGYSLGWSVCDLNGEALYFHSGFYAGVRSMMAFMPSRGAGIAAYSNSDDMTGFLTTATVRLYFQYLTDDPEAGANTAYVSGQYASQVARNREELPRQYASLREHERWQGWQWQPSRDELAAYTGAWRLGPYLDVEIRLEDSGLIAYWGAYTMMLEPAAPDLFGGQETPMNRISVFQFERDEQGELVGLQWGSDYYTRD